MTEQLKEIGLRIAALREIMEFSQQKLADACCITKEELVAYEAGEGDLSVSFLYSAAKALGVDVLEIMSGESPKLSMACVVRQGEGYKVVRRKTFDYRHLAYTFRGKKFEPFLVTVESVKETPKLNQHAGQEFNYVLEGRLLYRVGDLTYILEPGDSIYFDSSNSHSMEAMDEKPARFLAVITI